MSRIREVRDYVKGLLDAIPDWSFKSIPGARIFEDRPDSYPGGTLSLESSVVVGEPSQFAGQFRRVRQLSGVIALYGSSDASYIGDADALAWDGADLVVDAIDGRQPQILFGADELTTVYKIQTGQIEPFLIDNAVFGVYVPFTVNIEWTTYHDEA